MTTYDGDLEWLSLAARALGGERPAWHAQARCRGMDPAMFFPSRGFPVREVRAICAECPVSAECLEQGLHEKAGVWGGTTEHQRRRIRRERADDATAA